VQVNVTSEDMGDKPPGKTLDRKDGTRGYSKRNCRWATVLEQAQNRKATRRFTYNGKTLTIREHCDLSRIEYKLVIGRMERGWDFHRAISTPRMKPLERHERENDTALLDEIHKLIGVEK
jgi:hypothetical protein